MRRQGRERNGGERREERERGREGSGGREGGTMFVHNWDGRNLSSSKEIEDHDKWCVREHRHDVFIRPDV